MRLAEGAVALFTALVAGVPTFTGNPAPPPTNITTEVSPDPTDSPAPGYTTPALPVPTKSPSPTRSPRFER